MCKYLWCSIFNYLPEKLVFKNLKYEFCGQIIKYKKRERKYYFQILNWKLERVQLGRYTFIG